MGCLLKANMFSLMFTAQVALYDLVQAANQELERFRGIAMLFSRNQRREEIRVL